MGILLKPSSSGALEREKAPEFIHVSNTSESAALAGRTLGFPVKRENIMQGERRPREYLMGAFFGPCEV